MFKTLLCGIKCLLILGKKIPPTVIGNRDFVRGTYWLENDF